MIQENLDARAEHDEASNRYPSVFSSHGLPPLTALAEPFTTPWSYEQPLNFKSVANIH